MRGERDSKRHDMDAIHSDSPLFGMTREKTCRRLLSGKPLPKWGLWPIILLPKRFGLLRAYLISNGSFAQRPEESL